MRLFLTEGNLRPPSSLVPRRTMFYQQLDHAPLPFSGSDAGRSTIPAKLRCNLHAPVEFRRKEDSRTRRTPTKSVIERIIVPINNQVN